MNMTSEQTRSARPDTELGGVGAKPHPSPRHGPGRAETTWDFRDSSGDRALGPDPCSACPSSGQPWAERSASPGTPHSGSGETPRALGSGMGKALGKYYISDKQNVVSYLGNVLKVKGPRVGGRRQTP